MKIRIFYTLCVVLLLLNACETEPKGPSLAALEGNWVVFKATRNKKITGMLNGTWFQFAPNQMRTNLPSESEASELVAPYTLTGDKLLQQSEPPVEYTLKNWADSTFNLAFVVRGLTFELSLRKTVELPVISQDTTQMQPAGDSIQ